MSDRAEDVSLPDISALITENDDPVDNFASEKNQRLLTEALYASWQGPPPLIEGDPGPRQFLAAANVGVFEQARNPAIVPDVLVSTDVSLTDLDEERSYFVWRTGKPPELVIEIVSNTEGDELTLKKRRYARMHVSHYVVFDPARRLSGRVLRVFSLAGDVYREEDLGNEAQCSFPTIGLGVRLWKGTFENVSRTWLRFIDERGALILTGAERAHQEMERAEQEKHRAEQEKQRAEQEKQRAEQEKQRAEQEKQRAEQEKQRAEQEKQRAEQEKQRAERLAARLRALGEDPGAD